MSNPRQTMAEQIALAAAAFQKQRTGHRPKSVSVVMSGDTLVVTLHGALSPAELVMAKDPKGAARVQEFHRQLFNNASSALWTEISRITGMEVKESTTEVEPASGTVVQVFTSGNMVQVFQLAGQLPVESFDTII